MLIQIPDGFLPLISDDGLTVACGFNRVVQVALPSGDQTILMENASACGFHAGQIAISKYDWTGRELINGPISVPLEQLPGVNPTLAVARGHVVSSAGGQHFIDGQPVSYDTGGSNIDTNDGQYYGYKPQNVAVPWPFVVREVATQDEAFTLNKPITEATVWTDAEGYPFVFGNLNGSSVLYDSFGTTRHAFQPSEFRGALSDGPSEPWAWTCGQFTDGSPFICGRPFSDLSGPGIVLRGLWWAGLAVVWKPVEGRWVVAGYYNGAGGTLYVDDSVDPAQPREVLDLGNSAPVPIPPTPKPPEPPTPEPPQVIIVRPGQTLVIKGEA